MATIDVRRGDEEATIKVASSGNNKKSMTPSKPSAFKIKFKKGLPKVNKAGNWKDASINIFEPNNKKKNADDAITASSPSPMVNQLDDSSRETFNCGQPFDDYPDLQQCKHCKKAITRVAAKDHIAQCLKIKKEKAQRKKEAREAREREKAKRDEDARRAEDPNAGKGDDSSSDEDEVEVKAGSGGKTTKKAAGKKTDVSGKKRKAGDELDKGRSKKKKEEPKKAAKPKGPVDVERQCGVTLPNGQPCARSLTCKSHSMGAKRAVPGRSLPYDMLLAAYQKKNQAKQQKAAIDANAPLEDDDELNAGAVDSDEETAAVMSALAHWNPQPVVPQPVFVPIKRQYQLARLHEQLQTATNGGRVNIFKVNGFGAQRLPDNHPSLFVEEDAPGEPDTVMTGVDYPRRSSSFGLSGPPQRRPSVSSRA
ncbi:SCA7, zinc-binding domain-containing protein [Cladorrhinum samala]|uniref:SCA7, zinc-binding domain-containing protein n=1 Tax=Cladorrhinum samala TaxID=585594 RepID=A0AAV9HF65_9PEZI|nr:SCA7, zinc-binding domain-containing protein [Cladorrhinum samala]